MTQRELAQAMRDFGQPPEIITLMLKPHRRAWNKGGQLSQDHRDKISAGVRANRRPMSDETKERLRRLKSIDWTPELIAAVQQCRREGVGFHRMESRIGVCASAIWRASKRGVFA